MESITLEQILTATWAKCPIYALRLNINYLLQVHYTRITFPEAS